MVYVGVYRVKARARKPCQNVEQTYDNAQAQARLGITTKRLARFSEARS